MQTNEGPIFTCFHVFDEETSNFLSGNFKELNDKKLLKCMKLMLLSRSFRPVLEHANIGMKICICTHNSCPPEFLQLHSVHLYV